MVIHHAIVGCGHIGHKHIQASQQLQTIQPRAVCDVDTQKISEFQNKYGDIQGYTDYTKLLANPDIDSVSICVPSGLHHDLAIQAAHAHKHILIEKPIAMDIQAAKEIIEAARDNDVKLAVVFQNRYKSAIQTIKSLLPLLGKLVYVSANVFRYRPQSYYNDGVHGQKDMDGGVLMNQAIHFIDAIMYIADKKIQNISPLAATLIHTMEMEDTITVNFSFEDQTLGNIQANTITYPENYE